MAEGTGIVTIRIFKRIAGVFAPLLLAVAAISAPARGDVVVSLNDLGTAGIDAIIADNSPAGTMTALGASTHADADATVGQVGVPVGLTVGNFLIDPATSAFAMGGGASDPLVDLLLFVETLGAGVLQAQVTSTDITTDNPLVSITGNIGGISIPAVGPGDVVYTGGYDSGNGQFTFPGGSTIGPVAIGGGAFGSTVTIPVAGSNPFSLSQSITITATGPGQVIGFDAQNIGAQNDITATPEPATVVLWFVTAGIVGRAASRRRRRQTAAAAQGTNR